MVGRMVAERSEAVGQVPLGEQVGLVLRAYRRERGLSQRALAQALGVPQPTIARLECAALTCSLDTVLGLLAATGHTLGVVDTDGRPVTDWDATDRRARDRSGRRFPAHRDVREVAPGGLAPLWWTLHEFLGTGECGPQPRWTAEGFPGPPGTQFGKKRRPRAPGEVPRWI